MASRVWKDGTRRGIAYVEGREAAERALTAAGRMPVAAVLPRASKNGVAALDGAMAVYTDQKGRPFAWQFPFDIKEWEAVRAAAGVAE